MGSTALKDKYDIAEDNKYIFVLLPSEYTEFYIEHIKEPIEAIELENQGKVRCESYLDIEVGEVTMDKIWEGIKKAGIVIIDISKFKPNVMFELGVTYAQKNDIIIIVNADEGHDIDLPYNLQGIQIKSYSFKRPKELTNYLVAQVFKKNEVINTGEVKTEEVKKLMISINSLINNKDIFGALALFSQANEKEPNNWFILKEWGMLLRDAKDYKEAITKLHLSLELTTFSQSKSIIHLELAKVYIAQKSDVNIIMSHFQAALSFDNNHVSLYVCWAAFYAKELNYQKANEKMLIACKLEPQNSGYKRLCKYYHEQLLNILGEKRSIQLKKEYYESFRNHHKLNDIVKVTIDGINKRYGVFVKTDNGATGLIHKKKLLNMHKYYFKKDQLIQVKVISFDDVKYYIDFDLI